MLSGTTEEQRREAEMEGFINYMDDLGSVPVMYMGDFNSFSPEDYGINTLQSGLGYGPCSMLVDPYTDPSTGEDHSSQASTVHLWSDVHTTLNDINTDWVVTSPAYDSRIDFIYANDIMAPYIMASTTGDTAHADTGSDHYSVDVIVDLSGSGDYSAPSVAFTNPLDGEIVSGSVSITVDATDENGIDSQTISIDGTQVSTGSTYTWDTTQYTEGQHTLRAEATDPSGNVGYDEITVTVDNDGYVADPSNIVINEFLPDPYELYSEEFIELYNPMSEAIDISGCILDDLIDGGMSPYTIPAGTSVPANGFIVFWQSDGLPGLNNDGDDVNFIASDGTTVYDSYSYSSSQNDVSYGRETDGGSTWTTFTSPTPGASNEGSTGTSMHVASITFTTGSHGPFVDLDITVKIVDENGNPVANTMVYGDLTLPDLSIISFSGETDTNGEVTFSYSERNLSGTCTFTVTDVTHSSYSYDSSANVETSDEVTV